MEDKLSSGGGKSNLPIRDTNEDVYASPLTTMATDLAIANADSNVAPYTGDNDGTTTAAEFVAALPIAASQVASTLGFGIDSVHNNGDSTNGDIVYATILEQDAQGFDNNQYDFQMIVPEVGLTWSSSTAYYFYVELTW